MKAKLVAFGIAAALTVANSAFAQANNNNNEQPSCTDLPSHTELVAALKAARAQQNGGFNLDMWATVVDRDGVV